MIKLKYFNPSEEKIESHLQKMVKVNEMAVG
jgi:hypothetical protein